MEYLISQIDVPGPKPQVEEVPSPGQDLAVFPVQYAVAKELAEIVGNVAYHRSRSKGRSRTSTDSMSIAVDQRTNVIVILGTTEQIGRVKELVNALDVPIDHSRCAAAETEKTE